MEEEEEACKLGIGLGLGGGDGGSVARVRSRSEHKKPVQLHHLFPLHPKQEIISSSTEELHSGEDHQSSSMAIDHEEEEEEHKINIISDSSDKKYGTTKKLRLTKEQLALLEDCFKRDSSLNMTQKQELAVKLNIQPRQVEVWFQNRRARTKQKQAEVECEVLRRCCKSLSHENKKLKKELQGLKMVMRPTSSHLYVQVPTMCPCCEDERNKENTSTTGP